MGRALRAVHRIDAARLEPDLIGERQDSIAQFAFFERLEFIEPWGDKRRKYGDHHKLKGDDEPKHPDPPVAPHHIHQPKHDEKKRHSDQ